MRRLLIFLLVVGAAWAARAEEVPITILHTTDLHAHVWPTTDYDGKENVGGCARIASAVAKIRAESPNVLLVDAGDTIQGTLLGYMTDGQVMVKYLNYMKYDAWVLGNHEWDWGLEKLSACVAKAEVPVMTANVMRVRAGLPSAAESVLTKTLLPYRIVAVQGVKVAIIGLTTPGIPNWSRPRLLAGMGFEAPVDALKRVIPEVKAKGAQVIILVTHQGWREQGDDHANQLNAVAREFPEIDAIVGGHSHRLMPEYKINGVLYSQANYWGTYLGRIDLVYDTAKKKVVRAKAAAIAMDASAEYDKNFLKLVSQELDAEKAERMRVVGESAADFSPEGGGRRETPIHNLICGAIAEELKSRDYAVAAVFHGLLDDKASLRKGAITVGDVWRIVPYENTIGVAELNEAELKEIMEEDMALWERNQFRGLWALHFQLKPSAPIGQRVISIADARGVRIQDPSQRHRVAFNSYDLASAGTRLKKLREICERPTSNLREFDFQTRQAVIDYIQRHKVIRPETFGWWETVLGR